jgi:hypothetical protein
MGRLVWQSPHTLSNGTACRPECDELVSLGSGASIVISKLFAVQTMKTPVGAVHTNNTASIQV